MKGSPCLNRVVIAVFPSLLIFDRAVGAPSKAWRLILRSDCLHERTCLLRQANGVKKLLTQPFTMRVSQELTCLVFICRMSDYVTDVFTNMKLLLVFRRLWFCVKLAASPFASVCVIGTSHIVPEDLSG